MAVSGRVALITGASSGIGKGAALKFAELGYSVSITGRRAEALKEVEEKILSSGGKVLSIQADLDKDDDCTKVVEKTAEHFGRLDVLVNSAGILVAGNCENTSMADFDRIFRTNVRTLFLLTKLAIPHLKKTKGNIVNVSSVNGIRSFAGVCAYNMTKSAVDQLTKSTALELAADGVRVNSVNPGVIITDIHKRAGMNDEAYQQFLERSKVTHPLGRAGTVDEVSSAIAYLASPEASFVTGNLLSVDGGRGCAGLR